MIKNDFSEIESELDKGKIWLNGEVFNRDKGIATKIKPLSISELVEKYREIDATPSIMAQTRDFLLHLNDDIEKKFREVLDKRGISEAEWKEFGSVDFLPKARMYKYKGEGIFIISEPDVSREELKLDCKVVYGELKQH